VTKRQIMTGRAAAFDGSTPPALSEASIAGTFACGLFFLTRMRLIAIPIRGNLQLILFLLFCPFG
jgi:hypothetical protein